MEFSAVIGALPNFVGKMKDGLTKAGVDKAEFSAKMLGFCASDAMATAMYDYAMPPAIPMDKVTKPVPGMRIAIDHGWVFTVVSVHDLSIDYEKKPDDLIVLFGFEEKKRQWMYRGTNRKSGRREAITVVGYLSQEWTDEIVTWLVSKPGCRFKGSGAWVMDDFHVRFSKYRMPGVPEHDTHFVFFPGDTASWWELNTTYEARGTMCMPHMCFSNGKWRDQFVEVKLKMPPTAPLCLLWE